MAYGTGIMWVLLAGDRVRDEGLLSGSGHSMVLRLCIWDWVCVCVDVVRIPLPPPVSILLYPI